MNPLFERLFSYTGRGVKTFNAMQRLDAKLGSPHRSFQSVHIGGTNGKGSVTFKTAKSLQAEGYRVGLYTSPHIADFRERIRVDGEMIPEADAARLLEKIFSLVDEELSFFDLLTALAFLYFQEQKVDWAVIEVGLGGRLDATNVILPEAAAIVSIGIDHAHILGNSLEEIAREKGGIAKPGVPLVAGPTAAPFYPGAIVVERQPTYDLENSAVAAALLKVIGIQNPKALGARPPCRFERVGRSILDVAHNPDGFKKLIEALQYYFPNQKHHFALAFSHEKDWRACIDLIAPHASRITSLKGEHEKLIPAEVIASYDSKIKVAAIEEIDGPVIICGSFYIMDAARSQYTETT